jgi:hypothetical protein
MGRQKKYFLLFVIESSNLGKTLAHKINRIDAMIHSANSKFQILIINI